MFLGVDGGGTKTAFVLIDIDGHVLAQHQESTCYHVQVGLDGAKAVLHNGVRALFNKAGKDIADVDYAFFGLPAFGEDSELDGQWVGSSFWC